MNGSNPVSTWKDPISRTKTQTTKSGDGLTNFNCFPNCGQVDILLTLVQIFSLECNVNHGKNCLTCQKKQYKYKLVGWFILNGTRKDKHLENQH